jgi:hypothetical protein
LSVAVLGLRMKINRIGDSELKALCDAMLADDDGPPQSSQETRSPQGPRQPPLLKLVK